MIKRQPLNGYYREAKLHIYPNDNKTATILMNTSNATAEQCREAAHLLNQLAEYLDDALDG